jgi:hypothetical protein
MTSRLSGFSRSEGCAMDIESPWELEYWARHFHVSEHELRNIVRSVGPDTEAVARFIRSLPANAPGNALVNATAHGVPAARSRAAMTRVEQDLRGNEGLKEDA